MAVGQYVGMVIILMVTLTNFQCSGDVDGPFLVECLDHNLMITVMLFSEATEPHIEAIDRQGRFPIPRGGEAQCGYTYEVYKRLGVAVLRASYFSCYTENKDDMTFTFKFHLSLTDHDEEVVHRITKTCSPPSWSHREITCEENYIEVSVQTDLPWHMQSLRDDEVASVLPEVNEAATALWQIMFLRKGKLPATLSVAEAAEQGYFLDVTPSRIVFRTAHGQEYSVTGRVSGLDIEDIRPVVFLRQGFRTVIVDLAASCTLDEGSYDDALIWKTLLMVSPMVSAHSGFQSRDISIGVEGRRLDPNDAAKRDLRLDVGPEIVEVSVPYGAQGGLRKTFVMDNAYHEFYAVCLFYEHVFTTDGDALESRLHYVREMTTPVLFNTPFTTNLTVLEERVFTVYVGDFPFDVELISLSLNGKMMTVHEATQKGYRVSKIPKSHTTHGYTIYVPFEDPLVSKVYLVEGVLEYSLTLNYTLHILPQEEEYFYLTTVVAHIMDVYPPNFNGVCMENGIKFRIEHQEFDCLFEAGIGPYPLTQELADARGYIMTNDSQSLTLEVPLFTVGYRYEDVSLERFFATFEIVIRNAKSLKAVQYMAKTCLFPTTEMLVCSPNGTMTVVADLTKAKPSAFPFKTTLLDKTCTPREVDEKRVLFEFSLNSCGTRFQVTNGFLTYENEILFEEAFIPEEKPVITRDSAYRVILQCVYPVHAVNRLVIDQQFESETPGKGTIKMQNQLRSPVTVAPKESATTTRRVTTTTPIPTVPTLPQTTGDLRPVKYIRVYGRPQRVVPS